MEETLNYKLDMALSMLQQILAILQNEGQGLSVAVSEQNQKMNVVWGG